MADELRAVVNELRCGRSRSFTTPFMILRVGRRRPTEVFFSADARDPVRTEAPRKLADKSGSSPSFRAKGG